MPQARLERVTYGLGNRCSILLSYWGNTADSTCAPGRLSIERCLPASPPSRRRDSRPSLPVSARPLWSSPPRTASGAPRWPTTGRIALLGQGAETAALPALREGCSLGIVRQSPGGCAVQDAWFVPAALAEGRMPPRVAEIAQPVVTPSNVDRFPADGSVIPGEARRAALRRPRPPRVRIRGTGRGHAGARCRNRRAHCPGARTRRAPRPPGRAGRSAPWPRW
jgi:hypothetical protein